MIVGSSLYATPVIVFTLVSTVFGRAKDVREKLSEACCN
uniref:Uncharacterized protein n=1 Tax=Arundo donax TaxID=35708 RepID=A0A0A8ZJB0_ARUDO